MLLVVEFVPMFGFAVFAQPCWVAEDRAAQGLEAPLVLYL